MKVLLTGANGFIGSQVTRTLRERGHQVTALVRPGRNLEPLVDLEEAIEIRVLDLNDGTQLKELVEEVNPEAVVHLAWYTAPGKYGTAPENLACIRQSLNLALALRRTRCRRLLGAGTCAEYDWSGGRVIERETPCQPRSLYGAAKYGLFLVLDKFCQEVSISFAWARYGFLFGPREKPDRFVPSVIQKLSSGEDVECLHPDQRRDFLYVKDAATATVALLESEVEGAVNIASGRTVTNRHIVKHLARQIGGSGKPIFGGDTPDGTPALSLDVRRLVREVGWRPHYNLEEALEETVSFWRGMARPT